VPAILGAVMRAKRLAARDFSVPPAPPQH